MKFERRSTRVWKRKLDRIKKGVKFDRYVGTRTYLSNLLLVRSVESFQASHWPNLYRPNRKGGG